MIGTFLIHCLSSSALPGGIIFFLCGKLMQRYPPHWPNYWYGYRTPASLRTKESFDAANTFSATLMITYGIALVIFGFAFAVVFQEQYWWLFLGAGMLAMLVAVAALIAKTEKYIANHFDRNGRPL